MSEATVVELIGIFVLVLTAMLGWTMMTVVRIWGEVKALQSSVITAAQHASVWKAISSIQEHVAAASMGEPSPWFVQKVSSLDVSINDLKVVVERRMTAMETQIHLLPCGTNCPRSGDDRNS